MKVRFSRLMLCTALVSSCQHRRPTFHVLANNIERCISIAASLLLELSQLGPDVDALSLSAVGLRRAYVFVSAPARPKLALLVLSSLSLQS